MSRPSLTQLLSLAWPIVVSRSSQVVVGVADAVMVAGLGESALAATTTGAMNAFNVLILPMGIVFIVSSFASQLFGRGDHDGARRYGFYGLVVAGATQALCVLGILLVPALLGLFDYGADVRLLMTDYLKLRLLSGGAAIGIEALANYYAGLGNTRLPMLVSVLAMVLNVAGNWVLIFGHLGAPAMGVSGAALASTLATSVAFVAILACFLGGIGARRPTTRLRLSRAELGGMLRYGLPSGFNWFFEFLAFSFFVNVVVAGLGTTALAAMMAVLQLNSVSFMPAFGLASAGAVLVGQAIGAGAHDDVRPIVRLTLWVTTVWQGLVGLSYILVPELLIRPFLDPDSDTRALREVGERLLMLSAAWQLFDATANTLSEALRAAGDTAFTLWARLAIAWLVFVPGVYVTVGVLGGGDVGAISWVVAYLAALASVLAWRFRSGAWRKFDLAGMAQHVA